MSLIEKTKNRPLFIRQLPADETHAYAYDGNGNVTGLYNMGASGAETAKYEYGPFGESIGVTGTMGAMNPMRFSTKYNDAETDFLYYGHRYYDYKDGRWINRDPIEEEGAENLYAFISNETTDRIDVLGLYYELLEFNEAVKHWQGGTGDLRSTKFKRIDISSLRVKHFTYIRGLVEKCERLKYKSFFEQPFTVTISREQAISTSFTLDCNKQPDLFMIFGTITVKVFGKFDCCMNHGHAPLWKFEGEAAAFHDTFDWDWFKFNVRLDKLPKQIVRNFEQREGEFWLAQGSAF